MASCLLNIYIWLHQRYFKTNVSKIKELKELPPVGKLKPETCEWPLVYPSFLSPPLIKPCHFYVLYLRSALSPIIPFPPPPTQIPRCHCVRWSSQDGSAGWLPPFSNPRFHPSARVGCPSCSTSPLLLEHDRSASSCGYLSADALRWWSSSEQLCLSYFCCTCV